MHVPVRPESLRMKKVVITGAGSGIGMATSIACVSAGFYVIAADSDRLGLKTLQAQLPVHRLETHLVDLSGTQLSQGFISDLYATHKHRTLHALVNNVGAQTGQGRAAYSEQDIAALHEVNFTSLMNLSSDFARQEPDAPHTRSIVNINAASDGAGEEAFYHATGARMIDLTRANAWSFGPRVRVNAVSSPLNPDAFAAKQSVENWLGQPAYEHERQRFATTSFQPGAVADAVMFLLSEHSHPLTGKVIVAGNATHPF